MNEPAPATDMKAPPNPAAATDLKELVRRAGHKALKVFEKLPTGNNRQARRHYAALLRASPRTGTSGRRAFNKRVSKRRAKKGYQ